MKKIIILGLVLLMVVVFATSIFAKAEKSDLINNDGTKTTDPTGDVVDLLYLITQTQMKSMTDVT